MFFRRSRSKRSKSRWARVEASRSRSNLSSVPISRRKKRGTKRRRSEMPDVILGIR